MGRCRVLLALVLLQAGGAYAAEALHVAEAWVPEAPPVAGVMAGYLTIQNRGQEDVTIMQARSEGFSAVEMHATRLRDGMASMIKQDTLRIPAGATVKFERGGLHLMLMRPKRPFKIGESIPVEFITSHGNVKFVASVRAASLDDASDHHHHHH